LLDETPYLRPFFRADFAKRGKKAKRKRNSLAAARAGIQRLEYEKAILEYRSTLLADIVLLGEARLPGIGWLTLKGTVLKFRISRSCRAKLAKADFPISFPKR